jgi:uncharacterized protein
MTEVKKIYYSWANIKNSVIDIALQMYKDDWKPDYIVGITRGGNIPAVMLSHMIDVPCNTLKVSLRDGTENEINCWMSEDAFGYIDNQGEMGDPERYRKNILIIDDINDTGATIDWIKKDWQSSCLPNDKRWNDVWHKNVKFATIVNNLSSSQTADYYSIEINKEENPCWIVFPWEDLLVHNA